MEGKGKIKNYERSDFRCWACSRALTWHLRVNLADPTVVNHPFRSGFVANTGFGTRFDAGDNAKTGFAYIRKLTERVHGREITRTWALK